MTRPATRKEIRAHYKALGLDCRIRAWDMVEVRRNRHRFPGAAPIWHETAIVSQHLVNDTDRKVILK